MPIWPAPLSLAAPDFRPPARAPLSRADFHPKRRKRQDLRKRGGVVRSDTFPRTHGKRAEPWKARQASPARRAFSP